LEEGYNGTVVNEPKPVTEVG